MSIIRLLPRFRNLDQQLDRLALREQWARREIESFQLACLNRLWAHASVSVPYYRQLLHQYHLPSRFANLVEFTQQVPILDKTAVRTSPYQFLSQQPQPGRWHRTGGSTGRPMSVYWSHDAHLTDLRARYRAESARDVQVFDRKVFLWSHSQSLAPGWRGWLARMRRPVEDRLRNRLCLSAYQLGSDDLNYHLQAIKRFQPISIYGYSSAVYLLARAARVQRLTFPGLKLVTLSAEPIHRWIQTEVNEAFGTPVLNEYGSVECGITATSDAHNRLRIREDNVLLEALLRDDGYYDIVISVLHNPSFPLLRYRIEDLTSTAVTRPPKGFAWLQDVSGRNNDLIWSASGRPLHPMVIKHTLEHFPAVRRFTAKQDADGALTIFLETEGALPEESLRNIASHLTARLEGYTVNLKLMDTIQSSAAGKHRWVVSTRCPPNEPDACVG